MNGNFKRDLGEAKRVRTSSSNGNIVISDHPHPHPWSILLNDQCYLSTHNIRLDLEAVGNHNLDLGQRNTRMSFVGSD